MKLLHLLKSLQPAEYKDFEKFLQCSFFKSSKQYLKFFKYLQANHPKFKLEKTDLEEAYRRCFGAKSLTDTKLYNLMSGMGKQIEQFLVVRMVISPEEKQPPLFDQLLVKSLSNRTMGAYFRKEAQRVIDEIQKHPILSIEDYQTLNLLSHEIYFNPDTPKEERSPLNLILADEHLDHYYFATKLGYLAEFKTRERIYSVEYAIPRLEILLAACADPVFLEAQPVIALYYQLVGLYLSGVTETAFRDVLNSLNDKFHLLNLAQRNSILSHLVNCGGVLLRQGVELEPALLSLYKLAIQTETLLIGNRITYPRFFNIVNLAILSNELDWANTFYNEFSENLDEGTKKATLDLTMAYLKYAEGDIEAANGFLTSETAQISLFEILAKKLLIKIAFDRYIDNGDAFDFLDDKITGFDRYIQAQSLSNDKTQTDLNWIKFVRKLVTTKSKLVKVPPAKKKQLRDNLDDIQSVSEKKWLYAKIEAL